VTPPVPLVCPEHQEPLSPGQALSCPRGCRYAYVRGVPRFVSSDNYAAPFGSQWKAFRKTQLDSWTGTTITKERLTRCLGGSIEVVRGKRVLEAGCGAGRFTELLLAAGAHVFACDISEAVEANFDNCSGEGSYFVCQADIRMLPVQPRQFDDVVCLGVIQHTPDPEATIRALAEHVRPGGYLVIDHYTGERLLRPSQAALRWLLLKVPPRITLPFCSVLASALWPLHRLCWRARNAQGRLSQAARQVFLSLSPIVDYQYSYPSLGPELLKAWAVLDTHDALTDYYKHSRTADEVAAALAELGFTNVTTSYAGNGVEARAQRPVHE
jgi:SAM-dependent methyltransferase